MEEKTDNTDKLTLSFAKEFVEKELAKLKEHQQNLKQAYTSSSDKDEIKLGFIDNLGELHRRIKCHFKSASSTNNIEKINQLGVDLKALNENLKNACDTTLIYDVCKEAAVVSACMGAIFTVMLVCIMISPPGIMAFAGVISAAAIFTSMEALGGLALFSYAAAVCFRAATLKNNIDFKVEGLDALAGVSQKVEEELEELKGLSSGSSSLIVLDSSSKSGNAHSYTPLFSSVGNSISTQKFFLTNEDVEKIKTKLKTN